MIQTPQIKSRLSAIFRSTTGNFLEQFDFFLFGFYAVPISQAFFPRENQLVALMLAFTTFWLGAMMRPVGALVLGPYIDKVGRKKGLIITLSLMAIGTLLIAVCPTFATIGIAAPLLVLIGRLLQGFSSGAEVGGVTVYLFEISSPGNRGFYTSFQSVSQQVAVFTAAAIGYLLHMLLPVTTIAAWGWRIPFVIGCLILPFIFVLRRSLEETPEFLSRKMHPSIAEVFHSVLANRKIIFLGVLLSSMSNVAFYFITIYTPTFGKTVLKLESSASLIVTLCVAISNCLWLPIGGMLSDRFGRKPVLLTSALLTLLTAYPLLSWLVARPNFEKMLAVELILSFFYAIYNSTMAVTISEIVPAHVRATCYSLAYSLSVALFGTFTPLLSTWLISTTGNQAASGFWLTAAAAAASIATLVVFYRHVGTDNFYNTSPDPILGHGKTTSM